MKIKREDFKALIKECLIEILSDGIPVSRPRMKDSVRESVRQEPVQTQRQSSLPDGIPSPLKSLFSDSQRRAADKMYQESIQADKQGEVLGDMASTWDTMTFGGAPLPSRAANPYSHIGGAPPPQSFGREQEVDYDDGFDPYEAVKAAIPKRR